MLITAAPARRAASIWRAESQPEVRDGSATFSARAPGQTPRLPTPLAAAAATAAVGVPWKSVSGWPPVVATFTDWELRMGDVELRVDERDQRARRGDRRRDERRVDDPGSARARRRRAGPARAPACAWSSGRARRSGAGPPRAGRRRARGRRARLVRQAPPAMCRAPWARAIRVAARPGLRADDPAGRVGLHGRGGGVAGQGDRRRSVGAAERGGGGRGGGARRDEGGQRREQVPSLHPA